MSPLLSINQQAFYYSVQVPRETPAASSLSAPVSVPKETILPGTEEQQSSRKVSERQNFDTYECQTCKNRKYKDGSDNPGVSFKTPTHISPQNAAYAIRSHEMEHVSHAQAEAQREDQDIVSQSVTYHTAICPECGRTYLAGGTTRTVFQKSQELYNDGPETKGSYLDVIA